MTADARLRVSLAAGELELEGSEEFIREFSDSIAELLKRLPAWTAALPSTAAAPSVNSEAGNVDGPAGRSGEPPIPEFGEVLHRLPHGVTGTEQILVAGFYASRRAADKTFATADANKLLIEQGIKLANPSQSLKNNMDSKRVFKTGKNYKLSRDGVLHIAQLTGIPNLAP